MPTRLSRNALVAGAASCALALATAAPGVARPIHHPLPHGGWNARADQSIGTSSLAGTTEADFAKPAATKRSGITAPGDGATTLAVLLIGGGALAAGAGAGFAGGRRVALRPH